MMIPKTFEGINKFMDLEKDNEKEPIKKSINKDVNDQTIIDIGEDEIENIESDCTNLTEQEVIECETEDVGVNKSTGFDALQSMAEFMRHSVYGYSFMNHLMKDDRND